MTSSSLDYRTRDGIGIIEIDRPHRRNALRYEDLATLAQIVTDAGHDPTVRALVLTGRGGSFCAGIDLGDLAERPPEERQKVGWSSPRAAWFLMDSPLPVVAAVDGPAAGMGAEISCQADIRIGTESAQFLWNFTHRGLVPDMGVSSLLLPHIVGLPTSLDLLCSGRSLSANEAVARGYLSEIVPAEELLDKACAMAERLAVGSPFALARLKALVYDGLSDASSHLSRHEQALTDCLGSQDHAEGVAAFLEKRPAVFTGR